MSGRKDITAHKNPLVVPVSLSFVRAKDPGLKGHKMVVVVD